MTIEKLGKEFNVLLALADYPEALRDRLYEYYYAKHDFILTNFKDFEVVDNRIIIPLSEKDIYDFKKPFMYLIFVPIPKTFNSFFKRNKHYKAEKIFLKYCKIYYFYNHKQCQNCLKWKKQNYPWVMKH